MSPGVLFPPAGALWLGILTALGPCALGPGFAAMAFLARGNFGPRDFLSLTLPYALGRFLTFFGMSSLALSGLVSNPALAHTLQSYMPLWQGPIFVICGLFLLGLTPFPFDANAMHGKTLQAGKRLSPSLLSALMGVTSAVAFCPASAALFFLGLLPLALKENSMVFLPTLFALGTLLPVLVFAALLSLGLRAAASLFKRVVPLEKWVSRGTGLLILTIGTYQIWKYIIHPKFG